MKEKLIALFESSSCTIEEDTESSSNGDINRTGKDKDGGGQGLA